MAPCLPRRPGGSTGQQLRARAWDSESGVPARVPVHESESGWGSARRPGALGMDPGPPPGPQLNGAGRGAKGPEHLHAS
jgi:hypothetical protein